MVFNIIVKKKMSDFDPLKLKRQLHVDKVAEFEELFWLSSCVCVCGVTEWGQMADCWGSWWHTEYKQRGCTHRPTHLTFNSFLTHTYINIHSSVYNWTCEHDMRREKLTYLVGLFSLVLPWLTAAQPVPAWLSDPKHFLLCRGAEKKKKKRPKCLLCTTLNHANRNACKRQHVEMATNQAFAWNSGY